MATATVQLVSSGFLKAGQRSRVQWNNPARHRVFNFSVEPGDVGPEDIFLNLPISFRIADVSYAMDQPGHFVIWITIENNGKGDWNYSLYMSS
jgi:hypothetical protein